MHMDYTESEYETLKGNVRKIIAFIKSDIIPGNREYIRVEFGDRTYGSYEYTITVSPYGMYGAAHMLSIDLTDTDTPTNKDGVNVFHNAFTGADYMAKLCRDWKQIKTTLLDKVAYQRMTIDAISNFEV